MTDKAVLTGKKFKAIEALLACDTVDQACKACGISRTTMYRFLQEPEFDKEFKRAKRQLVSRAILRLQQACGDASRALAEICRNGEAPPSARVSAAREILSSTMKAIETEEIEERLKAIEDRLKIK